MPRKLWSTTVTLARGILFPVAAWVLFLAGTAGAGGFDIAWNDCGNNGVEARTFACNTDGGTNTFYISAMPNSPIAQMVGMSAKVSVYSSGSTLSPWWHLEPSGGCRSRSLTANFNFVTGPYSCEDPWGGAAMGGILWKYFDMNPGARARLEVICAVQPTAAISANSGTEYYLCSVSINNSGATSAACSGCGDALCFVIDQVNLASPNPTITEEAQIPDQVITSTLLRQKITWQGGPTGGPCASINTPKQSTWGGIKSIYH